MEDDFNDFSELSAGETSIGIRRCLKQVSAERDQLRAELAAAKEQADRAGFNLADAKGEIAVPSRKLEDCQAACASHETANKHYYEKLEKALAEGRALAADNARLRKALQPFADRIKAYPPWMWTAMIEREKEGIITGGFRVGGEAVTHMPAMLLVGAEEALAATPAQSLAAHDAAVKVAVQQEVASRISSWQVDREYHLRREATGSETMAELLAEADRIEKESSNG